jgi:carboxylate-amine ligase
LRHAAAAAAKELGLVLAGAGSHPSSDPTKQEIASNPRYGEFVEYAGISARRQGVSGLHVHVGMPDAESCLRTLERVLPWLPVVLALSANSPYFDGKETGMASMRAEILAILPRHGAPPAFESFADWERFVERFIAAGLVRGYSGLHWDVRPHPTYGTLEIRAADQPTSLSQTGALVALLHGLCVWAAEQPPLPAEAGRRGVYEQNRWAAARFGPRAELLHPERDGSASVPQLYAELVERIGVVPGLDPELCEGDRQLAVGRVEGLQAVCADLVARSVA